MFIVNSLIFAQTKNEETIMAFRQGIDNGNLKLRLGEEIEEDDFSGNFLTVTDYGKVFIHCWDRDTLLEINADEKKLEKELNLKGIVERDNPVCLSTSNKNILIFRGSWGRILLLDTDGFTIKSRFYPRDSGLTIQSPNVLYDEESDVLFYQISGEPITCLVHPTMDMQENKRNYHDAAETKALLEGGTYAPHLSIDRMDRLVIDGKSTYFDTVWIGNYRYQVFGDYEVCLWNGKLDSLEFEKKEGEIVESTAIHPSGDVYRLIYNQKTKLHTLYRIQNTWDPSWRKEWYNTHQ